MTEFDEGQLKLILRAELAEFQIKLVNLFVGRSDFTSLRDEVHEIDQRVRRLDIPDEDDIARVAQREFNQAKRRSMTTFDRVLVGMGIMVALGVFILQIKIASAK